MTSRAEALTAKAAQQWTKAAPTTSTPAAPAAADDRTRDDRQRAPATAANPGVKPVRSTVDLMPTPACSARDLVQPDRGGDRQEQGHHSGHHARDGRPAADDFRPQDDLRSAS
jgi:hypothetical protein